MPSKSSKKPGRNRSFSGFVVFRGSTAFDDDAGLDDFLDVDRDDVDFERFPVLLVLALPDELRVERRVAGIEHLRRLRLVVGDEVPEFLGRDVLALFLVPDGFDFGKLGVGSFGLRASRSLFLFVIRWSLMGRQ